MLTIIWQRKVAINFQFVKNTISVKHNNAKCNKMRYACNQPGELNDLLTSFIFFIYGGFPGGLDGKKSTWNAGDLGSNCGWEDPLEKEKATHSSILAWRIPRTEEPGRLQYMESDMTFTFMTVLEQILETLIICPNWISYCFPYGQNIQLKFSKIHRVPPIKIQIDPPKLLPRINQYSIYKGAS